MLDVRSGIDNGGDRSSFQKSHIPGSVYSNYTNDGWRETRETRDTQAQLVDARPVDYFRGETKSPAAKAPGTIPGSTNLPHHSFIKPQNQVFYLDQDAISDKVNTAELNPQARTIAFCNTGHWAATDWFVLSELAGFQEVALYDGSMAEWSQDRFIVSIALFGLALLGGLIWLETAPFMVALFVVGTVLGMALYHGAFGFTAGWRNLVVKKRGAGMRAQLLLFGVTSLIMVPMLHSGMEGLVAVAPAPCPSTRD